MGFALLLLGLLPLAFMGTGFFGDGNDPDADDSAARSDTDQAQTTSSGSMLDLLAGDNVLNPVTGDETPIPTDEVTDTIDPDTILSPIEEDETPVDALPVDPETVLDPIDEAGEGYLAEEGNTLQTLLADSTDLTAGVDWLGDNGPETEDIHLGDGTNIWAAPINSTPDDGEGQIGDFEGTALIETEGILYLVDGGAGNDVLITGDEAAYAFGGAGDDALAAGDGAAALFGGDGDDALAASTSAAILDGGSGDDVIQGGDGDDRIFGGVHTDDGQPIHDDDQIDGGAGDDYIAGGFGADTLSGGDGDDVIDHLGHANEHINWERHDFDWHIDGAADTLSGGAGNDTLIMDRHDTATGDEGMDTFWVFFDGASGLGFADVTDFEPGTDFLRVTLNPDLDHGDMIVEVQPSDDGQDGVVTLNGDVVAMLRGASDATLADVLFEAPVNVFAG